MNDPAILFCAPNSIGDHDKATLEKAGVLVIATNDLASLWFTRAVPELSGGALLEAAAHSVLKSELSIKAFGIAVAERIVAEQARARAIAMEAS